MHMMDPISVYAVTGMQINVYLVCIPSARWNFHKIVWPVHRSAPCRQFIGSQKRQKLLPVGTFENFFMDRWIVRDTNIRIEINKSA